VYFSTVSVFILFLCYDSVVINITTMRQIWYNDSMMSLDTKNIKDCLPVLTFNKKQLTLVTVQWVLAVKLYALKRLHFTSAFITIVFSELTVTASAMWSLSQLLSPYMIRHTLETPVEVYSTLDNRCIKLWCGKLHLCICNLAQQGPSSMGRKFSSYHD